MEITEEMHIAEGILKAIEWLKQMGRPILADKMERELLHSTNRMTDTLVP